MKTGTKILIGGFVLAAAGWGIYAATRPKSGDEKRADLKKMLTDVTGAEGAAKVDEMSAEEVDTLHDTFSPDSSGSGGGGGGGGSYSPPASSAPAPKIVQSIRMLPAAMIMDAGQAKGGKVVVSTTVPKSSPLIKNVTKPFTSVVPRTSAKNATFTVKKKGIGSVDATDAVSILRKYRVIA